MSEKHKNNKTQGEEEDSILELEGLSEAPDKSPFHATVASPKNMNAFQDELI